MNDVNIKVCLYCEVWASGGIESFITEFLSHIERSKFEFYVVAAQKKKSIFTQRLESIGIRLIPLQNNNAAGAVRRIFASLPQMKKLCKEYQFDIVHFHIFHGLNLMLAKAMRDCGVKHIIVHSHAAGFRKGKLYLAKLIVHRLFCKIFSQLDMKRFAVSKQAGRFMFGKNVPVKIIHSGIDYEKFLFSHDTREAVRKELGIVDERVLGCIGRYDTLKNQEFAVEILEELVQLKDDAVLVLVGEGSEKRNLIKKASAFNILERVIFFDYTQKINELLCAVDVLLIPSRSEGLSLTAIEAQVSGLPLICSQGVSHEIKISPKVFFLPIDTPHRWAKLILEIPQNSLERNKVSIDSREFDIKEITSFFRDYYVAQCKT